MASSASDFLDAPRLARELRVSEAHPSFTELPSLILGAVDWVSSYTGLPLIDRFPVIHRYGPLNSDACLPLGQIVAPVEVRSFRWWSTDETDAAEGTLLERMDGMEVVPDVGRLDLRPSHSLAPTAYLWPRASGWPTNIRRSEVTIRAGLNPAEYPSLSDACVLYARGQFEGLMMADKRSALERLLEPLIQHDVDVAR